MPRNHALTRRSFFGAATAVVAATALPAQTAQANPGKLVPPAIGALPDLSGQARPFTNVERQGRVERARRLMASAKIDAIVLANSTSSSVYFADLHLYGGERLWALVIPAVSKPFLVCPAFEEGRARELLATGPLASSVDILTWQEDESPYILLGKALRIADSALPPSVSTSTCPSSLQKGFVPPILISTSFRPRLSLRVAA